MSSVLERMGQPGNVVTGAEITFTDDGYYTPAWYVPKLGAVTGLFKGIRNQTDDDIAVVVHPTNAFVAGGARKYISVKVYANSEYGIEFDEIKEADTTSPLTADHFFYPAD
jgi:hypothetical protein